MTQSPPAGVPHWPSEPQVELGGLPPLLQVAVHTVPAADPSVHFQTARLVPLGVPLHVFAAAGATKGQ